MEMPHEFMDHKESADFLTLLELTEETRLASDKASMFMNSGVLSTKVSISAVNKFQSIFVKIMNFDCVILSFSR
jgi:hypothetical protein